MFRPNVDMIPVTDIYDETMLTEAHRAGPFSDDTHALCEFIDNSISATASEIDIYLKSKNNIDLQNNLSITITDNGTGMNRNTLHQAVRLGSRRDRNYALEISRFGVGLTMAHQAMCTHLDIITKVNNGRILGAVSDIKLHGKYHPNIVSDENSEEYVLEYEKWLKNQPHGTIIHLNDLDQLKTDLSLAEFALKLKKDFGRIYHRLISNKKIKMQIHCGESVYSVVPTDPLCRPLMKATNKGAGICYSHKAKLRSILENNDVDEQSEIEINVVLLPSELPKDEQYIPLTFGNSGVYIYRTDREVAWAAPFQKIFLGAANDTSKHAEANRIRVEILLPGDPIVDKAVNMTFYKENINFNRKLKFYLHNLLFELIKKLISEVKEKKDDEKTIRLGVADDIVDFFDSLLPQWFIPLTVNESEASSKKTPTIDEGIVEVNFTAKVNGETKSNNINPNRKKRVYNKTIPPKSFIFKDLGENEDFYSYEFINQKPIITINTQFPFWKLLIEGDSKSKDIQLSNIWVRVRSTRCDRTSESYFTPELSNVLEAILRDDIHNESQTLREVCKRRKIK